MPTKIGVQREDRHLEVLILPDGVTHGMDEMGPFVRWPDGEEYALSSAANAARHEYRGLRIDHPWEYHGIIYHLMGKNGYKVTGERT